MLTKQQGHLKWLGCRIVEIKVVTMKLEQLVLTSSKGLLTMLTVMGKLSEK